MTKRRAPPPAQPDPHVQPHRDRRHYPRLDGIGLIANIAGKLVRVIEVSATGLTLERRFPISHQPMSFTLYPSDGKHVDLNSGMRADALVVHEEPDMVGLRFEPATLALVKFCATHMP